jgi:hypothetical protein
MPVICPTWPAEYFCLGGLTRFPKIRSDLPVVLNLQHPRHPGHRLGQKADRQQATSTRTASDVAELQLLRATTYDLCRPASWGGVGMRRFVVWALMLCVMAQFGGCASSSVPEAALESHAQSQPKQRNARLARLYFLREKGMIGTEVGIKIDGKPVGSVAKGLYFSVDRPPGRYRIACVNPISMDYETEIQIEGGRTYYFGIGTPQVAAPGQNLLNQALAGSSGQQMPATSPLMGAFPVLRSIRSMRQKALPSSVN